MPYITNSNVLKIINEIDTRSIDLNGDIYKNTKFAYFNLIPRGSATWVSTKEGFGKPLVSQDYRRSSYIPRRYGAVAEWGGLCPGVVDYRSKIWLFIAIFFMSKKENFRKWKNR